MKQKLADGKEKVGTTMAALVGVHEYEAEQLDVETTLRCWLKGSRNTPERGRRVLAYIRTGRVKVPKLARQLQRQALRLRTPDDFHIYVAPCRRGIKKLGFTREPVQRHQQLQREFPQVTASTALCGLSNAATPSKLKHGHRRLRMRSLLGHAFMQSTTRCQPSCWLR